MMQHTIKIMAILFNLINPYNMENTAKTRQQIAREYGISYKTLTRWMKREGLEIPPGLVRPHDCAKIYDIFGHPIPPAKEELKKPSSPIWPIFTQLVLFFIW
jgi:hypothetical protein